MPDRLNRLETKCFGKPSEDTDLGQRVESLEAYAQRHDIYGEYPPNNKLAEPKNQLGIPNGEITPFQPSSNESAMGGQQNIQGMVSTMETQVFGHTHPHLSLPKGLPSLRRKFTI